MCKTTAVFARFRAVIDGCEDLEPNSQELLIDRRGRFACHYAPFDHINIGARVVIVGITPGKQQAVNATASLRDGLRAGMSDADALRLAKHSASFSGPMRTNLVAMLDHLGFNSMLELDSCMELFTSRTDLVHFTSALRYPVFKDGKNYSGDGAILSNPFLRSMWESWLAEEADLIRDAWWIPLGERPAAVLAELAGRNLLDSSRVLSGMLHPSPSSNERIAYFLGRKPREQLSIKTNAVKTDRNKQYLLAKLAAASPHAE